MAGMNRSMTGLASKDLGDGAARTFNSTNAPNKMKVEDKKCIWRFEMVPGSVWRRDFVANYKHVQRLNDPVGRPTCRIREAL
jgi:hypothetical protein